MPRSSSLHVDSQQGFTRDGRDWGALRPASRWQRRAARRAGGGAGARSPRRARLRRHETERVFILTTLVIAGIRYPIEVNLAARRGLKFPMLLGRTALAGRFLVDPARKHALTRRARGRARDR